MLSLNPHFLVFLVATGIPLGEGCIGSLVPCEVLDLVPTRWNFNGSEVNNTALKCEIKEACELNLTEVIMNNTNFFMLDNQYFHLDVLFNCTDSRHKLDFSNTAATMKKIIITMRLRDCGTSWDDINFLGSMYSLMKVEMIQTVPGALPTSLANETDVMSGLAELTYLMLSFNNFLGSIDLHQFLPFQTIAMDGLGVLRVQCLDNTQGKRVYCPRDMVKYNSTLLRVLFPKLQTLSLNGVYPVENVSIDFPWYSTPMSVPFNFSHSFHYLILSTTEEYRDIGNAMDEISRVLCINGQYGLHVEYMCPSYKSLHTVLLRDSNLSYIPSDCFAPEPGNRSNLHFLDLTYNSFEQLNATVFRGLYSLEILHLAKGKLTHLPNTIFDDLTKLKVLNLNYNEITELRRGIFAKLVKLKSLFIHYNKLISVESQSLPTYSKHLTFVDVRNNNLTTIPRDCLTLPYLHTCDCDHNQITLHDFEDIVTSFHPVNMLFMQAWTIYGGTFNHAHVGLMHESDQTEISLRDNPLEYSNTWLEDKKRELAGFLSFFELTLEPKEGDNYNYCDCDFYNLKRFITSGEAEELVIRSVYYHILLLTETNFQSWKCKPHRVLQQKVTQDAAAFLTFDDEYFVCEASSNCPNGCECFNRANKADSMLVDCYNRNITEFPTDISSPSAGGELIVDLRSNSIEKLPNSGAKEYGWLKHVTTLNLEGNPGFRPETTQRMLTFLKALQGSHLYLANCNIRNLPDKIQTLNFTQLTISGNALLCDCHTYWLKRWLQNSRAVITDGWNTYCADDEGNKENGQPLMELERKHFQCPQSPWEISGPLLCLMVAAIILGITFYIYEFEIKIILFEKLNWHPFDKQEHEKEKDFDAFLMYHRNDEPWVINTLRVGLERSGYKLCIAEINWRAGGANAALLTRSLQDSCRVIVVVSQSFIDNTKTMSDFHFAHEFYPISDKKRFLILVKLSEELDLREHDVLKGYISTNFFVSVNAKRFWSRLCYWMPRLGKVELPASTSNVVRNDSVMENTRTTRI